MQKVSMIVIVLASLASLVFAGLKTIGSGDNKQFDVTRFPEDMQAKYDIMKVKCIKCHTLEVVMLHLSFRSSIDSKQ